MRRERDDAGERERKKERVRVCEREAKVLAFSSFTYFRVGNMLLNMFKLK